MERFTIEKNPDKMFHWDVTDNESGVICTFEHGKFSGKKVFNLSMIWKPKKRQRDIKKALKWASRPINKISIAKMRKVF